MRIGKRWIPALTALLLAITMAVAIIPAGVLVYAEETDTESIPESNDEANGEGSAVLPEEIDPSQKSEKEEVPATDETDKLADEKTEISSDGTDAEQLEENADNQEEQEELTAEENVPSEEEPSETYDAVNQEPKTNQLRLMAAEPDVEVSTYAQLKKAINNAPAGVETRIRIKTGATIKVIHGNDGNRTYSHFGNEKPDYIHWDYSVPSGKIITIYCEGEATIISDKAGFPSWIGVGDGATVKIGSGDPNDKLNFINSSLYVEKGGSLEVVDGVNIGEFSTATGNYGLYLRGTLDIHGGFVDQVLVSPGGVLNSFDGGSMRRLSVAGVVKTIGPNVSIINPKGFAIDVYNVPSVYAYQSENSSRIARGTGPAYIEKIVGGTFVGTTAVSVSSTSPNSGNLYGGIVEIEDGKFVATRDNVFLLSDSSGRNRWSIKKITDGTFIANEGSVFKGGLGGSTYYYGNANKVLEIEDGTFISKNDVFAGANAGTIKTGYFVSSEGSIFAGSSYQAFSGQRGDFKCVIDYLEPGITEFRGNARYYCGENEVIKPSTSTALKASITKIDDPYVFSGSNTVNESIELPEEYAGSFAITYDFQTLIRPAKVTFDLNGGSSDSSDYADRDVDTTQESTNKVEMPADQETPIRENYILTGWVNEETGEEYEIGDSVTITKDTTFVAQYKYQYMVGFDPNGGEGTMDDITVTDGEEVELPENQFTREGYTFDGWNTAKDGSGDSYADGSTVADLTEEAGFTITLYAVWKPIMYTITYKLDGGTYNGSSDDIVETYEYGTEINIHSAPVRGGMTFSFWQGSEYQPGDKYKVVEDHTFTAVWKMNQKQDSDKAKKTVPNTSDTNNIAGWTVGVIGSMLIAAAVFLIRRKFNANLK